VEYRQGDFLMLIVLKCVGAITLQLLLFGIFGSLYTILTKQRFSVWHSLVTGLFFYYGCFSVIYVPAVLLRFSLTLTMKIWILVCAVVILYAFISYKGKLYKLFRCIMGQKIEVSKLVLACVSGSSLAFLFLFVVRSYYFGYDTAYYSKMVEHALVDNQMYGLYELTEGPYLNMRYALSGYFMHIAMLSKLFGLHHFTALKIVGGGICCIYAIIIVAYALSVLFANYIYVCLGLILWTVMQLGFAGTYNQSSFLLYRAYEGKGYCSSVILPLVVLCAIMLWKRQESHRWWSVLYLISATCNFVSMSAMIIVPIAVFSLLIPLGIVDKDFSVVKRISICEMVLIVYLVFYYVMSNYVHIMA
jgi:hypothetical protein